MDFIETKNKIIKEINSVLAKIEKADSFVKAILAADKIFVVGSGRSGLIIEAFAQRLNHLGLNARVVGSIVQPPASRKDLLIVASGSGESVFSLAIAQKAKKIGMKVALITAEKKTKISKIADLVIYIPADSKKSFNSAKKSCQLLGSLFEQCLFLFCDAVAVMIRKAKKIPVKTLKKNHANLE